jgi:hypothetical protein
MLLALLSSIELLHLDDSYKENIRDIKVRTDFKMLEVKVPIIFFRHVGFPLRRDGRYVAGDDIWFQKRKLFYPEYLNVVTHRYQLVKILGLEEQSAAKQLVLACPQYATLL